MCTRIVIAAVAAAATAAGSGTALRAQSPDAKAAEVIAAARKALGGEEKVASLQGLSLRGTYRRELTAGAGGGAMFVVAGGGGPVSGGAAPQVSGDLEIDFAFPDRFIKVDTSTGMMAMTRTEGYDGDRPFLDVASSSPGVRIVTNNGATTDASAKDAALQRTRGEAARLLLGLIAGAPPSFPVTWSYVGQAESPDGKADVVDVKGPGDFAVRLFVDAESHLPLMLTYMAPEPRVVMRAAPGRDAAATVDRHGAAAGGAAGRELSPEERERLEKEMRDTAGAPKMVEMRMFFADYRDVGGLLLPHRISRGTAAKTNEEWEISRYTLNPSFKADRFKVGVK